MRQRINQSANPPWHLPDQTTISFDRKYYQWLIAVLSAMLVIFVVALLANTETNRWFIKEGGVIETMSAAGYIACVILMSIYGRVTYLIKQWFFPVVLLAFAMRELDFDKRFTEVGILKSKFLFSPADSVTTKIIGISIVLFVLFAACKILRAHGPGLLRRIKMKTLTPVDCSAGIGIVFLFVSKSLDGLDRKLSDFGIVIGEQTKTVAAHLEESLEWAIPFLFIVSVLSYFSLLRQQSKRSEADGFYASTKFSK